MALFKVSIKQSGQYNGCKVEKGMDVEVSFYRGGNNLTGTIQGQKIIIAAFQKKYGLNIKPIMGAWNTYLVGCPVRCSEKQILKSLFNC